MASEPPLPEHALPADGERRFALAPLPSAAASGTPLPSAAAVGTPLPSAAALGTPPSAAAWSTPPLTVAAWPSLATLARDPGAIGAALTHLRKFHAQAIEPGVCRPRAALPASTLHGRLLDLIRGQRLTSGAAPALIAEKRRVEAHLQRLTASEADVFVLGNFQPANIRFTGAMPYFADCGAAGMGHPVLDLARYAVEVHLPACDEPALLLAYAPGQVMAWAPIMRLMMHLWHLDRRYAWQQVWQDPQPTAEVAAMIAWHEAELARCRADHAYLFSS